MRFVFTGICTALLLSANPAMAIDQLDAEALVLELRLPQEGNSDNFAVPTQEDTLNFFNLAACECDATFQVRYQFRPETVVTGLPSEDVKIFLGNNCDDFERQPEQCIQASSIPDIRDLANPRDEFYGVQDLVQPLGGACELTTGSRAVFALIDEDEDSTYENTWTLALNYDHEAPPLPNNIETVGGEDSVVISWDLPSEQQGDLFRIQALCMRADGSSDDNDNFPRDSITREYETAFTRCPPMASSVTVGAYAGSRPPATALPEGLAKLDERLLCGDTTGSANSLRITGLENDVAYRVVLVAIDQAGNPAALDAGEATPLAAVDFWEHYKQAGGTANGGCSQGTSGAAGGLIVGLLTLIALGFRRLRSVAAVFVLVALPLGASAQTYWDGIDDDVPQTPQEPTIHWNVGLKFGPYTPDIDSEFSSSPGPFEQVFGSEAGMLSSVDVEYFFLHAFGQLGVTGSIGFLPKKDRAFQTGPDGKPMPDPNNPGEFVRSTGDQTRFRLIPLSLGVVYRLTELDDRFKVPIIPYARAGLSYYMWWITQPNGDLAEAPTMACADPSTGCGGDNGQGASLGYQATIGVALRLERLDPGARTSLDQELGISHAGLYAEMTHAKVNGFGSSSKLSVGDTTWFGGINFEF